MFRKSYFQRVDKQFNIEQKLTSKEIPNLLLPVKFDLVGKNEREVVAEFVNTENPVHIIANQVSNFYSFREAVPNSARFLVASDPDKNKYPEQHSLWYNLYNEKKISKVCRPKRSWHNRRLCHRTWSCSISIKKNDLSINHKFSSTQFAKTLVIRQKMRQQ